MEHEPIRVGQVREMPGYTRYTVTDRLEDGLYRARCGDRHHIWRAEDIYEPVVGWSWEHLPPPVLTANPAEVVEGEVRNHVTGGVYRVRIGADGLISAVWPWDLPEDRVDYFYEPDEIVSDVLVSRPGVTL